LIIAIPTANGRLAAHFGHVQEFTFLTTKDDKVVSTELAIPPPHEPGILPQWLNSKKTDLIIAGGMGRRAIAFFNQYGIKVILGAPPDTPKNIAGEYLKGQLKTGNNLCDH